jgi:hypothetical protein
LVGAVAFLARGPSDVRTVVTGANNTYRSWATVPTSQAYAIIAGQYGIPAAFIEWFRGQMRPGETYYWALGPPPRKDPNAWLYQYHNHWITYEMLPYVAVETPRKADVVMLYNMTERRWRRTHPGRISIRMFDAKHGIGRWQR